MAGVLKASTARLGMRPTTCRSAVRATALDRRAFVSKGTFQGVPRLVNSINTSRFTRPSTIVRVTANDILPENDFSLPLAVSMAGYSFYSYLEPAGAEGFEDIHPDGTISVFTDPDFITEQFKGIMIMDLISATSLSVADFGGTSDPYARVQVGPSCATSKVIDLSLNPVWNERYFFYLSKPESDILKIDVFDKDLISEDDELGFVVIPLSKFNDGQAHEMDLKLLGANALKGRIQIRLTIVPVETLPTDMLEAMAGNTVAPAKTSFPREQRKEVPRLLGAATKAYIGNMNVATGRLLKDVISKQQAFQEEVANTLFSPPDENRDEWKTMCEMVGARRWQYGSPVVFVDHAESDTQAWIYRRAETKDVVVAFRGVEAGSWNDLVADQTVMSVTLKDGKLPPTIPIPVVGRYITQMLTDKKEISVHESFYRRFSSVENQLSYWVDEITGTGEKVARMHGLLTPGQIMSFYDGVSLGAKPAYDSGSWSIYVTGHGLGGALAQLFAHKMAIRPGKAAGLHEVTCYTFGAPRVGNQLFADELDLVVPNNWRVTHDEDVAPFHPRTPGFVHTPKHASLNFRTGEMQKEFSAENINDIASAFLGEASSGVEGSLNKHIEPAYMSVISKSVLNKADELADAAAALEEDDALTPEERAAALEYI